MVISVAGPNSSSRDNYDVNTGIASATFAADRDSSGGLWRDNFKSSDVAVARHSRLAFQAHLL
jgi:hypothetical protein